MHVQRLLIGSIIFVRLNDHECTQYVRFIQSIQTTVKTLCANITNADGSYKYKCALAYREVYTREGACHLMYKYT